MGCAASLGATPAGAVGRFAVNTSSSAAGAENGGGADTDPLWGEALRLNEEWRAANRINMSRFTRGELDPNATTEARLLRATAATFVFGCTAEDLAFFLDPKQKHAGDDVNAITIGMSPASMNFGVNSLSLLTQLANDISNHAEITKQPPNAPVGPEQRMRVLRLKAAFDTMLNAHSVNNFEHPRLATVPLLGSLLSNCLLQRGVGRGNGRGSTPDDMFPALLAAGADPNARNSAGVSCTHMAVAAVCYAAMQTDDRSADVEEQTLAVLKMILDAGGDPSIAVTPFGKDVQLPTALLSESGIQTLLSGTKVFQTDDIVAAARERGAREDVLQRCEALLREAQFRGRPSKHFHTDGEQRARPTPTWTQAMRNTMWASSLLAVLPTAERRRDAFASLAAEAPFFLPGMAATPAPVLTEDGAIIHRLDLTDESPGAWRPTPVEKLPRGSRVLFISHRWLRPGQPDDEKGTKLKQILAALDSFAKEVGCSPSALYVWNDFSCVDQSSPLPGVQALPLYQMSCDAFVLVDHPQYNERAWCRTEAYLQARLGCLEVTHRLPDGQAKVEREPAHRARSFFDDPALGLLYSEADRAALAVLTGLFREQKQQGGS